jgi:hypothetical protein
MKRQQFLSPRFFQKGGRESTRLKRVNYSGPTQSEFDEAWLQELLFGDPELLPVSEIEPVFDGLIPLCRELRTSVGPLDILFVNGQGLLTIVECKLWRNPEARRSVVGQILDYAQEIHRYDFDELNRRVKQARKDGKGLFEIVAEQSDEIDEAGFVDEVSRNLRLGRFLLLVVGDGIREDVENISSYLQDHATLNFCFGLVEQAIYRLGEDSYFVQPRLLTKTVEIERAVIRIEGNRGIVDVATPDSEAGTVNRKGRRFTISEQVFFEELAETFPAETLPLQTLLRELEEIGIGIEGGQNSLILKTSDPKMNFFAIRTNGLLRNYQCANLEEGRIYLQKLAALLGGVVFESDRQSKWTVKKKDGSYFKVTDLLAIKKEYVSLCAETVAKLEAP